jgi:hypothetical protein
MKTLLVASATLFALQSAIAQVVSSDSAELKKALQLIEQLTNQLAAQAARIEKLEVALGSTTPAKTVAAVAPVTEPAPSPVAAAPPSLSLSLNSPLPRTRTREATTCRF